MSIFDEFNKFANNPIGSTPNQYKVNGHKITCVQCSHDNFQQGKAQLNTSLATFFDLDWINRDATTLLCLNCGHIMWFAKDLDELVQD